MILGTTNTATTTMQRITVMPTTHHIQRGERRGGAGGAVKGEDMVGGWV